MDTRRGGEFQFVNCRLNVIAWDAQRKERATLIIHGIVNKLIGTARREGLSRKTNSASRVTLRRIN